MGLRYEHGVPNQHQFDEQRISAKTFMCCDGDPEGGGGHDSQQLGHDEPLARFSRRCTWMNVCLLHKKEN